jgi:hypothetical protein
MAIARQDNRALDAYSPRTTSSRPTGKATYPQLKAAFAACRAWFKNRAEADAL